VKLNTWVKIGGCTESAPQAQRSRKSMAVTGFIVLFAALVAVVLAPPRISSAQTGGAAGAADPAVITELVYANRILYDQGVLDGFGHVSVREANNPSRFLLSRSMAPALVTANDIVEYDAQGEPVKAGSPNGYLERYIHAAVYRARPDVIAVVHSHSAAILPFGLTGTPLRPVYHMSGFLGSGVPIFDIRDGAGQTDMLISNNKLGDALAKVLGDHTVVLMRGHGSVAVGKSIQEAVFRAVYAEVNSRIQMDAMKLGDVKYLTKEEAAMAATTVGAQIGRSWDLWKRRIGNIDAASH
jgi:ribulose-5-phosphate 4-epimerase/fuculose-1-phosphate aldolase